jgi:protein-glutamine gamma-glutamyltransferase
MLRSLSIPARVVKGFRGCDSQGDGRYVVRQRHAHAWVEVLVPRPGAREKATLAPPAGFTARPDIDLPPLAEPAYDWVSLDPTPEVETAPFSPLFEFSQLWQDIQRMARQGWQTLIVDYNADEQANLWDILRSDLPLARLRKLGFAASALFVIFCATLLLRRVSRRRPATSTAAFDTTGFYPRLVRILSRYACLRPSVGQTPREYGEAARSFLQRHPALSAVAELPRRVVELFYRVRFGAQPLNEDERRALDAELHRFATAVRQDGG